MTRIYKSYVAETRLHSYLSRSLIVILKNNQSQSTNTFLLYAQTIVHIVIIGDGLYLCTNFFGYNDIGMQNKQSRRTVTRQKLRNHNIFICSEVL